jgi:hypothetical protein
MSRATKALAALLVLLQAGIAQSQTDKPCKIIFDNHSRETIVIENMRVLQADGTLKAVEGGLTLKAGDRVSLLNGDKAVEGKQIFWAFKTMDGAIGRTNSTYKDPRNPKDLNFDNSIIRSIDDELIGHIRAEDKGRALSKAEATYRYWNSVHGIYSEETFDSIQNVGFLEFSKVRGYIRTVANRIDDLETEGIDDDAVAAAHTYSAFLREQVKMMNDVQDGFKTAAMLAELAQMKTDRFGKMLDEKQVVAGKAEDIFQFMRSRRKALEKRYGLPFPHLIPPVTVALAPRPFSQGYYVMLKNVSGDDLKNVEIHYTSVNFTTVRNQFISNRMPFDSAATIFNFTTIDPDKIGWRVDRGDWITVVCDDWAYSYPSTKLIKK